MMWQLLPWAGGLPPPGRGFLPPSALLPGSTCEVTASRHVEAESLCRRRGSTGTRVGGFHSREEAEGWTAGGVAGPGGGDARVSLPGALAPGGSTEFDEIPGLCP